MLKRDVLKGPSCLTRAADDEPIFVLRANDEVSVVAIRVWAEAYMLTKGGWGNMSAKQQSKYLDAMSCVRRMDEWRLARALGPNGECPICGGIESCKTGCQDGTSPL